MKRTLVGWKEWVSLPQLGLPAIEAKIDTGAKTSALHAFELDVFEHPDGLYVRFGIHPDRQKTDLAISCVAPVIDRRLVSDSGGHREMRFVIRTNLQLGQQTWPIEITLTNRENMAYRMLLGREALRGHVLVDASQTHLLGQAQPSLQQESSSYEHRHFVP